MRHIAYRCLCGSSSDVIRQMSSFEKVVKNACKPKPAPPKSKVSRLLSATYTNNSHHASCVSTSTQSSPQHGPTTALFMMFAKLFPLAFESQTPSSVCLCTQIGIGMRQGADSCLGRVQGAHCPSPHGSEWCDRQCTPVPVRFGCSTIEKCCSRSVGRYALYFSPLGRTFSLASCRLQCAQDSPALRSVP